LLEGKKSSKKNHATVPLRKMLAPGKKRGTSVTRWLPYRDGNRLTKVVLGDVEVVLAKYYPPPTPDSYFIFSLISFHYFIFKINIITTNRQNESRWPTLLSEEDDQLAWVDFAGRRFAIVQTFDSGCGCYLWDAVLTPDLLLLNSPERPDTVRRSLRALCC
jgi:hypothetical protein